MSENPVAEIEMTALPVPVDAEVRYRMDVSFRVAITPIVARQNANVYLLMNVGNMLSAGEPVLSLRNRPYWKVPIYCAFPEFKRREKIGELAVDMNSGAILLEQSFPSSPQEIERHAEIAYDALTASSAGA
ncbi:MAG: hypothetical protein HY328_15225 [Chloroflexi bacterium]|nr:hypothetical protein [Chloroflexota bacterium]